MKTVWEWLDIDYTTDSQTIKKAYANQAKKYHPEENPEEFKQLRNAYKTAMKYASAFKTMEPPIAVNNETKQEKTEDTIKEPEYIYETGKNGSKEENMEPSSESKELGYIYEIGKRDNREENSENPPKSQESGYTYRIGRSGNKNRENPARKRQEEHFVYNLGNFDYDTHQRLQKFLERIDIIYIDNFMRDDINAWKLLFRHYECKNDFNNHDFVAAVVDALEQMPKINKKIRTFIGGKIFAANDSDVKMRYLRERYYNQQPAKRPMTTERQAKKSYKDISKKIYGKDSKIYKRYNLINSIVTIILICISGLLLAYGLSPDLDDSSKKQEMTISTKFLTETQGEIVILQKLDIYKRMYHKSKPFTADLNKDGYQDIVYYDSDTDEFLVEEYAPEISGYKQMGNVDDYCNKRNPVARPILFRFLQEGK